MMARLPEPLRQSNRFLYRLLVAYWLSSAAALTVVIGSIKLLELGRDVLVDANRVQSFVVASLQVPMAAQSRQALLQAYISLATEGKLDSPNVFLIVNSSGRVTYSSRPAWLDLAIDDPVLNRDETNDQEFSTVAACFRSGAPDCLQLSTTSLRPSIDSLTVVHPIQLPSRDLGLRPERFLLLVNYDPKDIITHHSEDLWAGVAGILLGTGLLTVYLGFMLRQRLLRNLTEAANTDGLTRLSNRTLFMEQAKLRLALAQQSNNELVFAIGDIDHFKQINDTYGHDFGDAALAHAAGVLRRVTRQEDLICRLGGEEFALLLNGSRQSAGAALHRLAQELELQALEHRGRQIKLQMSIGAVATTDCGFNIDYLYTMADNALYHAKRGGRNRLEWNDGRIHARLAGAAS